MFEISTKALPQHPRPRLIGLLAVLLCLLILALSYSASAQSQYTTPNGAWATGGVRLVPRNDGTTAAVLGGNLDTGSLITLTAQGAGTVVSADQVNADARGVICVIDITTAGGTPTETVTVQGKDTASGKYYTLLTSAALASAATTTLTVYPGTTAAGNTVVNLPVPHIWRLSAVTGGAGPAVTATMGCSAIK